jgi:hypothetical protein
MQFYHHGLNIKLTGLSDSLLRKCLNEGGLVAGGVDEFVIENLDLGVFGGQGDNLIGDGLGIAKCRNVLANAGEGELDALRAGTRKLSLALLADDDKVGGAFLSKKSSNASAHARVNTTAEALVRGADDDERFLVLGLERLGLGGLIDLIGGLTVVAGLGHGALSTGELGGGDNLHRVGDLLDVADGLEAALDLAKRRVAGDSVGGGGGGPATIRLVSKKSP